MKYPAFEALGLCTSTGVVEAGCKVAIGTRLKRAGMHLVYRRSQLDHCPTLLSAQWSVSGFLGTSFGAQEGRVTRFQIIFLSCAPWWCQAMVEQA
ncbi:MAG: hypothetical protein JO062_10500 [Bryobacterales bacterium]|nr:hypothetical protein [Bryobacterales bacterium]